jgi:hypothetical protein
MKVNRSAQAVQGSVCLNLLLKILIHCTPTAACLFDPICACVILGSDSIELREKAKSYISNQAMLYFFGIIIVIVLYY